MSRAQGIRGLSTTQTGIPRITGKQLPKLGTHGSRTAEIRLGLMQTSERPRVALFALVHQP